MMLRHEVGEAEREPGKISSSHDEGFLGVHYPSGLQAVSIRLRTSGYRLSGPDGGRD